MKTLEEYLNGPTLPINEQRELVKEIGEKHLRLTNEAYQKHIDVLKVSELFFGKEVNLNDLTYDLKNKGEVLKVAQAAREAAEHDLDSFMFFSSYLDQCLKKMNPSVKDGEELLKKTLKYLAKEYPANENTLQLENIEMVE